MTFLENEPAAGRHFCSSLSANPPKAGLESQRLILSLFVSYIDEAFFTLPTRKEALEAREQSPGHFAQ
jgi:hypothetical protein